MVAPRPGSATLTVFTQETKDPCKSTMLLYSVRLRPALLLTPGVAATPLVNVVIDHQLVTKGIVARISGRL